MPASFPNSNLALRTVVNRPGVVYDAAKTKVLFAEDINAIGVEIAAFEPSIWRVIAQTADVTVNNSTVIVDLTGLSFALEANSIYQFKINICCAQKAASDSKIGLSYPVGTTIFWLSSNYTPNANAYTEAYELPSTSTADINSMQWHHGIINTGANAGTFKIRGAQNSAVAENTVFKKGSILEIIKVG